MRLSKPMILDTGCLILEAKLEDRYESVRNLYESTSDSGLVKF